MGDVDPNAQKIETARWVPAFDHPWTQMLRSVPWWGKAVAKTMKSVRKGSSVDGMRSAVQAVIKIATVREKRPVIRMPVWTQNQTPEWVGRKRIHQSNTSVSLEPRFATARTTIVMASKMALRDSPGPAQAQTRVLVTCKSRPARTMEPGQAAKR